MPKPLAGITVIDLTHMLSGPYCTMLLADLGARTVKVEPPGGEGTRSLLATDPKHSRHGMGAYFLTLNRNKESVVIDLKKPDGRALFYELVKRADVVVNNFGPGVPKRLGIDYGGLAEHNPRIVTCSVTGFGETGPANARPAFDQIAQGMGGGMSITGQLNGEPTRAGIPIGDLGGGMFAAIGILAALQGRSVTGRGQHVDISMLDGQVSLLNYMATMFLLSGENPKPLGNAHFVHVPYDTFPTKDRWIIIAVITDNGWVGVVETLGAHDLRDPVYLTQPGRWAHRDFINRRVREILATRTADYWLEKLTANRVPCAPVNDFEHALNDPQVRARDMVVDVALRRGGSVVMPGNPIKLSDLGAEEYSPPPELGYDTDAVLRDLLGKSPDEIARLRAAGIVG
jgi:CoA:oxalate CoA-transferase